MTAQDVIAKMTDAEYKAWIEKGVFPKRLDADRKKINRQKSSKVAGAAATTAISAGASSA